MLDLVIITGASRGIGANIALNFKNKCKNLILIASSEFYFEDAIILKLDLHDYNETKQVISEKISKLDNIKNIGVVLCASQLGEYGGLLRSNLDNWKNQYMCNVLGNLAVIQACENLIKKNKTKIVFFSGGGGAYAFPEFSGYALTKTATIRAVENLAEDFKKLNYDASIIALAPGAVSTDMLAKVIAHGGTVKTRTDISQPTNFVYKFLNDEFDSKSMNGRFFHVKDDVNSADYSNQDLFKLRRIM